MNEAYFITGAYGCIGSWVVKSLIERGDRPFVFDLSDDARRLRAIMDDQSISRVAFLRGDVTDAAAVRGALESSGAKKVIHLAGLQVPSCKASPARGAMVNVIGTINVFEAAKAVGVDRIAYASSAAVYGLTEDGAPVDETLACEPSTHYGVFKRANEGNARVFYLDDGISSVGLRPLTVYGVGRDFGLTSDPTKAMKSAVLGRPFHIRFSGATDFLYVADTAAAFIASVDRSPEGAHVFNLHGDSLDVEEVVRTINDQLPSERRGLITFGGPCIPIAPAINDALFRSKIGEVKMTPLAEGVRQTITRFTELLDEGRLDSAELDG
ncbi:MAG TPA: SDR family oxidoreductase [Blastocatellia bacterium]